MKLRLLLLCISGLLAAVVASAGAEHVWRDGEWVEVGEPTEAGTSEAATRMRRHLADGEPGEAVDIGEEFLDENAEDPRREEVMVLLGRAEMDEGDYFDAFERFEAYLGEYPNGKYIERALQREYEIGVAFLEGRKRRVLAVLSVPGAPDGVDILERVIEHAPQSRVASEAMRRLGGFSRSRGKHNLAGETYDQYLKMFPRSKRAAEVMLKAARATYESYEGPEHGDTPLIEAEQRFRHFAERYPDRARAEGVPGTLEQIAELRAGKLIETAEFYRRVGRDEAAVYYYRNTVKRYPDTGSAEKARRMLDGMGVPVEEPEEDAPTTRPADAGAEPEQESETE